MRTDTPPKWSGRRPASSVSVVTACVRRARSTPKIEMIEFGATKLSGAETKLAALTMPPALMKGISFCPSSAVNSIAAAAQRATQRCICKRCR
jgi:hypothetical protein